MEIPPPRIRENHGCFDLPFWNRPVLFDQTFYLLRANELKAMLFVEADRPYRVRPGSDQYRTWRQVAQMRSQARSHSSQLAAGSDVGVANQSDVFDRLKAHRAYQLSFLLISPESNAVIDFMTQLAVGHVGFRPAVFRDNAFINVRAIVDDGPNQLKVVLITAADHSLRASELGIPNLRRYDRGRMRSNSTVLRNGQPAVGRARQGARSRT